MANRGAIGVSYDTVGTAAKLSTLSAYVAIRIPSISVRTVEVPSVLGRGASSFPARRIGDGDTADGANNSAVKSVQGTVKEQGVFCRRLLRVYRRDNGALLASGYSDLPGSRFHISWSGYAGQVFIIAFDDLGINPDFNCQVYDLITPS